MVLLVSLEANIGYKVPKFKPVPKRSPKPVKLIEGPP